MTCSSRARHMLSGISIPLDQRIHAVRGDLAAIELAGRIFVPHYAQPMPRACVVPSVMLLEKGQRDAKGISQLLFGETFMVVDRAGGWSWGYCAHDHYVGYVPDDALGAPAAADSSALVYAPFAPVFADASAGSAQRGQLPIGSRLPAADADGFHHVASGVVPAAACGTPPSDAAAVAEALIGTPYLWGGRTSSGIDCSGLVQLAFALTGVAAQRDSDMQQATLGTLLDDGAPLARNDLVFFDGHVGIMADAEQLIHANNHSGNVAREPLEAVVARMESQHGKAVTARKRVGA